MRVGFYVYCYLFLGLASLVQLGTLRFPIPGFLSHDSLLAAGAVSIVGIIGWEFGYLVGFSRRSGNSTRRISMRRLRVLLAFSIVASGLFAIVCRVSSFQEQTRRVQRSGRCFWRWGRLSA